MVTLRDGSETSDRRLDRLIQFDEGSRSYSIGVLVGDRAPRSYTWRPGSVLDQGRDGACVGFSWAGEAAARPKPIPGLAYADAMGIYRRAQQLDPWPGEAYSGTSVLAGVQACQERGWYGEYRWAFSLADALAGVAWAGPGVAGTWWHADMFDPDDDGFLHPTGGRVGGHAYLIYGVNVPGRYVKVRNSWGQGWGQRGNAKLSWDDFGALLADNGEFCIPVQRRLA